jgi:predicted nuclease of predicted toxin-antitoxin system
LHLLFDHNVPDPVAQVFRARGHTVVFLREIMPVDSPDPVVATVGDMDGAILVSCDHDFDAIAPRILKGMRARFRRLSRLSIRCAEFHAVQRVEEAMELIELEYRTAQVRPDKRMFIEIQRTGIKTNR